MTQPDFITTTGQFPSVTQFLRAIIGGKINWGQAQLTWPGGSSFSNTHDYPHGLKVTPIIAVATATLAPGTNPCVMHVVQTDAVNISWRGLDPTSSPGIGTVKNFYWIAIGA